MGSPWQAECFWLWGDFSLFSEVFFFLKKEKVKNNKFLGSDYSLASRWFRNDHFITKTCKAGKLVHVKYSCLVPAGVFHVNRDKLLRLMVHVDPVDCWVQLYPPGSHQCCPGRCPSAGQTHNHPFPAHLLASWDLGFRVLRARICFFLVNRPCWFLVLIAVI